MCSYDSCDCQASPVAVVTIQQGSQCGHLTKWTGSIHMCFFIHAWYFQTHAWSLSRLGSRHVDYDAWCSSPPVRAPSTLGCRQDSLEECQHVWHHSKNTNNRVKILEKSEKIRKIGEKPGIWRVIFDLLEEEYTSRAYLWKEFTRKTNKKT